VVGIEADMAQHAHCLADLMVDLIIDGGIN
jgi:hypothetical protein